MNLVVDACSAILLAKASVFEQLTFAFEIKMTKDVFEEVIAGKKRMFQDALLIDRLHKEKKVTLVKADSQVTKKLMKDFNMGGGEASTIARGLTEKNTIIITDNRQGRKAASINDLPLAGSIELIVSLFKKNKITKDKALNALKILKEEGWFNTYLIEKAMEDVK